VFCRNQPDLDFFIRTIRYIAATREVHESFRIGVRLLTGLQYPLGFPLIQDSAMCSPEILQALARGDERLLAILARGHAHPVHAANLCWSKLGASPGLVEASEDIVVAAMDRLEQSAGAVINRYCPVTERSAAGGGPVTVTTAGMARGREDMSAFLESPVWLLTQACRRLAVQVLPRR
jgi:hypothetical protein